MAPPTNMPTAVECSNGHSNGHSNGVMQHRPIIAKSLKRPISNISNNNGAAPVDAKREFQFLLILIWIRVVLDEKKEYLAWSFILIDFITHNYSLKGVGNAKNVND